VCVKKERLVGVKNSCFKFSFLLRRGQGLKRRNGHTRGDSSPGINAKAKGKWDSLVFPLIVPSCGLHIFITVDRS